MLSPFHPQPKRLVPFDFRNGPFFKIPQAPVSRIPIQLVIPTFEPLAVTGYPRRRTQRYSTVVNLGPPGSAHGGGSKGETAMKTLTKLTLVIAVLATGLASSVSASTHGDSTYYDTIRPHGHPRSDAIYNASVNACYRSSARAAPPCTIPMLQELYALTRLPLPYTNVVKTRRALPSERWRNVPTLARVSAFR